MNLRTVIAAALLTGLLVGGGGCALLVAKAVYDTGEVRRLLPAGHDRSLKACQRVLDAFNIRIESRSMEGLRTELQARWPDGTPLTLRLTRFSRRTTEVALRSGVVGTQDRGASNILQDRIADALVGS